MNNMDNEDPGEIYGTVEVIPVRRRGYYVYDRKKKDDEEIHPNEVLLLKDPRLLNLLIADNGFTIELNLKDWDPGSKDDEVSRSSFDDSGFLLDKPIFFLANGTYGSATVNYMVISDGVIAEVEVTLLNGNNRISTIVHGELAARNANFTNESLLFRKIRSQNTLVIPRTRIPLSRQIVCVPKSSSLIIRANLSGYDIITRSSFEIANGNAVFPAAVDGSSVQSIKGQKGEEIQVKVFWGLP